MRQSVRQSIGKNPPTVTRGLPSPKWDAPQGELKHILQWARVKHPHLYQLYVKADSGMWHSVAKRGPYKAQAMSAFEIMTKLQAEYKAQF